MITTITLADVATYPVEGRQVGPLRACNFFFGSNGAGKTTLSQFLKDPTRDEYPRCSVAWKDGRSMPVVVYNREFVSEVFGEAGRIKGVFTLGAEDTELADDMRKLRKKLADDEDKLVKLTRVLNGEDGQGGIRGELEKANAVLQKACLAQRKKHEQLFEPAMKGLRGDSKVFMARFVRERVNNTHALHPFEDLARRARSVFSSTLTRAEEIPAVDWSGLDALERHPIFSTAIVGKADVDLASLVNTIGNSDWVSEGMEYLGKSAPLCPFCQQGVPHDLERKLSEFFDASFAANMHLLDHTVSQYLPRVTATQAALANLHSLSGDFHDPAELAALISVFSAKAGMVREQMARKMSAPSTKLTIEGAANALADIQAFVDSANAKIRAHNGLVANAVSEQQALVGDFWRYLIDVELKDAASQHDATCIPKGKAASSISTQMMSCEQEMETTRRALEKLEHKVTSTQPTVDKINRTLRSFNFTNFSLAQASEPHTYHLLRQNGKPAHHTLSEGEKTFVTFLYFFHRAQAGESATGIEDDRVVVLDDPVSSLDSDVLFIVSSLVRQLARDVRDGNGPIRQLLVLTHNVYFHKEVTFSNKKMVGDTEHWTVRKRGGVTEFQPHGNTNPIKSSYELLWHDVRQPAGRADTLPNTMRRILESYFQLLGGFDFDTLTDRFEGDDLIACRAMLSWANDGSHSVHDDIHMAPADLSMEVYLDVFARLFDAMGQGGHYRMMMGAFLKPGQEAAPYSAHISGSR